jgi:MobA/MobL family
MAIYHFSAQVISRGKGQSAIASAAYRSGERLQDERTGETKYYKRQVQPETMILSPSHAPEWVQNRERLWNEVEASETRVNSRLAREINIALPRELSKEQQTELIRDYAQTQFVDQGMIADIAIHRDDSENPHAHIMLTTREISEEGFTVKNRDWNKKELLEQWREQWAEHANRALEREGIQDRISHLSHEARGLEQLPTIHLGHVAHEMEQRGAETDRGTINRERQEYNRLVVDLEKYREEKQAIEQEMAHKQAEKQKEEAFNTPEERVNLKEAAKVLKAEPTLQKIAERREQLDKWESRVNNNSQYIRWKDEKLKEAADHYSSIHTFEHQIQQAQQRMETINWANPLKIKENRMTKEQAIQDIAHAEAQITFHDKQLNYHRKKLKFNTETEFKSIQTQHQTEYPGLLEKSRETRGRIHHEKNVLQEAENAHKGAFVRQVASLYPERPEMRYMSLETAQRLVEINKLNGTVVPIERIEKTLHNRQEEIQRLQGDLTRLERDPLRLQRAGGYLKHYQESHAIVEKIESNPFLKGKTFVSISAKQEYDNAISERDHYHDLMKKEGVSGRTDFEKQTGILGRLEAQTPQIKDQVQAQEKGLGILEAVIKGIEQANRNMQREQSRQQQQTKRKKRRQRELDR